jgi:hypothetical protein
MPPDHTIATSEAALRHAAAELSRVAAPAARQDALDLLAVAAGWKPVCVLGRGVDDPAWLAGAAAVARRLGLTARTDAGWHPAPGPDTLPDWYLAATAPRDRALYLWRDPAVGARVQTLCAHGRVTIADEAALLFYPLCCVAQHHAQALALEQLIVALITRLVGDDLVRGARLVATGATPTPRTDDDWRRWEAAHAIAPEPGTPVNRCAACVTDPHGPAACLGARYRELARVLGWTDVAVAA